MPPNPSLSILPYQATTRLEREGVLKKILTKITVIPTRITLLFRLLGIAGAVAIAVVVVGCGEMQSPADVTESCCATLQAQIEYYVEVNHSLPSTLTDLPRVRAEGRGLIRDGWGNTMGYSYTPDGHVTLSSPGPRKILGKREAIIRRFRISQTASATSQSVTSSGRFGESTHYWQQRTGRGGGTCLIIDTREPSDARESPNLPRLVPCDSGRHLVGCRHLAGFRTANGHTYEICRICGMWSRLTQQSRRMGGTW